MVYLDNSASTFYKPKEVVKAVFDAMTKYTANPGRSGHRASIDAALMIEETRQKVSTFVNSDDPEHVIFTQNCTDALNLAILGTVKEGGHVICTENEHNSVLRPLFELKNKGLIEVSVASSSVPGIISLLDILPLVKDNTYLIITNNISNVDGSIANTKEIGEYCHENGILYLVDGAQSAGHIKIDMQQDNIDLLTLAPHKGLYAPQGVGVLIINNNVTVKPIRYGGTGTESNNLLQPITPPESLESGTLSTPNIVGLNAGIDFVNRELENIKLKLEDLSTYILYELTRLGATVYTEPDNTYGVLAFNINDIPSQQIANNLNENYGICVRGGLHCAPLKHKALGTEEQGAVRVSLSYFNTFSDAQRLINAVKMIMKKIC